MKTVRMQQTPKNLDSEYVKNNRPVSCLDGKDKEIEGTWLARLQSDVGDKNDSTIRISKHQVGGLPHRTCGIGLLEMMVFLYIPSMILFLDMKSCFCTFWGQCAAAALSNLPTSFVEMLVDWMSHRRCVIVHDGRMSDLKDYAGTLPQGSGLSLLLLACGIQFFCDFCTENRYGCIIFVDDIAIGIRLLGAKTGAQATFENDSRIKTCFTGLGRLVLANRIALEYTKCKIMFSEISPPGEYHLLNVILEVVEAYKYLGVWFTTVRGRMKWKKHIDERRKKVNLCYRQALLTTSTADGLAVSHARQVFNTLIAIGTYGFDSIGPFVGVGTIKNIEKFYVKALKKLIRLPPKTPTLPLFLELDLLPVAILMRLNTTLNWLRYESYFQRQVPEELVKNFSPQGTKWWVEYRQFMKPMTKVVFPEITFKLQGLALHKALKIYGEEWIKANIDGGAEYKQTKPDTEERVEAAKVLGRNIERAFSNTGVFGASDGGLVSYWQGSYRGGDCRNNLASYGWVMAVMTQTAILPDDAVKYETGPSGNGCTCWGSHVFHGEFTGLHKLLLEVMSTLVRLELILNLDGVESDWEAKVRKAIDDNREINIFLDPSSVLMSMENRDARQSWSIVFDVYKVIWEMWEKFQFKTNLIWVPSHAGVTLNEAADAQVHLADQAAYVSGTKTMCDIPLKAAQTAIKTWAKNWLRNAIDETIENSKTGILKRAKGRCFSTAKLSRALDLGPEQQYLLLRIRTETLNNATTSFSTTDGGPHQFCPHCSHELQTTHHFIFECSKFAELRKDILGKRIIRNREERARILDMKIHDLLRFCAKTKTQSPDNLEEKIEKERSRTDFETHERDADELIRKYREWVREEMTDRLDFADLFNLTDEDPDGAGEFNYYQFDN